MLISSTGTLVRTAVDEISVLGRNTQGVRLIRLAEGERLTGIERIEHLEGEGVDEGVPGPVDLTAAPTDGAEPAPESPPDSEN
jgi:DNA gyrase subunit A